MSDQQATISIGMDRDLPEGTAVAQDALGQVLAVIRVPQEKPPAGTRLLALSIEDYAKVIMACGRVAHA